MQKNITWFGILLKNACAQWENWMICVLMIICMVFVNGIQKPDAENMKIAISLEHKDDLSEKMLERVLQEDSHFEFYQVKDAKNVEREIRGGQAFCGFVIKKSFTDTLKEGRQKDCLGYLCLQETAKGRAAKETVYAIFLEFLSEQLIMQETEQYGKQVQKEAMEDNRKYLESDELFQISLIRGEKEGTIQGEPVEQEDTYPLEGIYAMFILLEMLLVNSENQRRAQKSILQLLDTKNRLHFRLIQYIVSVCAVTVTGMVTLLLLTSGSRATIQVIALPFMIFMSVLWAFLADKVLAKRRTYSVWMVTLLLFNMLTAPVFVHMSQYIPGLQVLEYVTPAGIYIHGMQFLQQLL